MADPEMAAETKSEKPDVKSYSEVVKGETKFLTELPHPIKPDILTSGKEIRQTTEHKMVKRHTSPYSGIREPTLLQTVLQLTSGKETHQTTEHEQPEIHQRSDLLHPSDDYVIEELNSDVSIHESVWYSPLNVHVPVLWNGDVYMTDSATKEDEQCKLLKYSTSRDSWSNFVISCNIKERRTIDKEHSHVLTTYDSKLLLVSGADSESLDPTMSPIKVWEFDATKSTFKPSPDIILPLRRTTFIQCHVAAASEGKYLIIGGKLHHGDIMQCYLYNGTTWVVCDSPCLNRYSGIQLIIHNGSIFLIERLLQCNLSLIYETSLWSIINDDPDPWQLLKSTMQSSVQLGAFSNFFMLETHLSLVSCDYHRRRFTVWRYFVNSESWQKAGSAGVSLLPFWGNFCSVRLPDESLVTIFDNGLNTIVYKLKSKPEESSLSPSARNLSREVSEESETSRRSRARRTRQSRQATQPVPADVLERIKKHDEEMSRSEESSGTSSTSSTPPQKRKDEEKATPIMSVFRPAARPTPKNKVLNPPSLHQTLWPSNRKKETSAPTTTAATSTTATATATESIPKAKGLSKKRLRVSRSLPLVKQEKTEKEVGTEKLTHSLPCLYVTSSAVSTSGSYTQQRQKLMTSLEIREISPPLHVSTWKDIPSLKPQQQSESKQIQQYKPGVNMGLLGTEVCGVTDITISNSSLDWQWEGFGLKLHVDANTLPSGIEHCCLTVSASLAGQYKFPKDHYLVSAVIWFRSEPPCRFVKSINVELQHCAYCYNASKLNFVKAVCSQKELPYEFKRVARSSFSSHSSFGVLEVNSFSGLAIVQKESEERNYLANFFYQEERFRPCFQLYFVITWNTLTHHSTAVKYFKDAKLYTKQLVVFDDRIEFQVSSNENWIVNSVNSKVVMKTHVDSFTPGETAWIPHSQFVAKFAGDASTNVPALQCAIDMMGAKMPHNKVKLDISHSKGIPSAAQLGRDNVAGTRPCAPTLRELMRALRSKTAFWEDIGIELQISDDDLVQIKLENARDFRSCLREMLRKWLVHVNPRPAWTAIIEALEQLGDEELAGRLRSKYYTTSQ